MIGKITDFFRGRSFLHDVSVLMAGSMGAQALAFVLMPVVTRLYTTDNFGIMTTFSAIVLTVSVFSTGSYPGAILLAKEDTEAWDALVLSLLICVIFSLFCLLIIIPFYHPINALIFKTEKMVWLLFVPISVFLWGLNNTLSTWVIRRRRFYTLSGSSLVGTLGNQGVKIISGLSLGNKVGGLIAGVIGNQFFPSLWLGINIYRKNQEQIKRRPEKRELYRLLIEYRNFPLYSTWYTFLVNFGRSIPIFFLAYLFDNSVVGAFGLANNVLRVPIGMVGGAVGRVFLQRAASTASDKKSLTRLYLKTTLGLLAISILPFGIIALFGKELFALIFGRDWSNAGRYAQIMVPWLLTMFVNPPSTMMYTALQRQRLRLVLMILSTLAQVLSFVVGEYLGLGVEGMLILVTAVVAVSNVVKIFYAYGISVSADKINAKASSPQIDPPAANNKAT